MWVIKLALVVVDYLYTAVRVTADGVGENAMEWCQLVVATEEELVEAETLSRAGQDTALARTVARGDTRPPNRLSPHSPPLGGQYEPHSLVWPKLSSPINVRPYTRTPHHIYVVHRYTTNRRLTLRSGRRRRGDSRGGGFVRA